MTFEFHHSTALEGLDDDIPRFAYSVEPSYRAWVVRVNGMIVGDFDSRDHALRAACDMARDTGRLGYQFEITGCESQEIDNLLRPSRGRPDATWPRSRPSGQASCA